MKKLLKNKTFKYLSLIFIFGFVIRLLGFNHGYPFIFHPDEATTIRSALGIRFEINPKHFDWPHLYIYFNYFVYMAFSFFRKLFSPEVFPILWNDGWIFYPLTRIVSAVFGICTLIPLYLSGKEAFSKKVGIFSALALSIVPLHIQYSHYALNEMPMVFFLSWGLYFSIKILKNTDNNSIYKNYLLAGLFIGLSASTKYNGGLSAIMVPLATLLYQLSTNKYKNIIDTLKKFLSVTHIYRWIASGIAAIVGFLIGTPFALFDFYTFTRTDGPQGALWQFKNVGSVSLSQQVSAFFQNIIFKISDDMGFTILLGFFVVLFMVLYKLFKNKSLKFISIPDLYPLIFLLSMGLYFLWYVSGFAKSRSHYYMISYPYIILVFGYAVSLISNFKSLILKNIVIAILFLIPLLMGVRVGYVFFNGDTRVDLYKWAKSNSMSTTTTYIYEVNALKEIFEKAKISNYKNGYKHILNLDSGYLVLSDDDTFYNDKYKLELINTFDNKLKRGPNLRVYYFEKL